MGQTLTHGVYLPDEGERNCYSGLAGNWQLLDGAVGTIAEHTTQIAGKASSTHTHGNVTNDGKVGSAANKPLITGTGGVVQTGSFGNQANTFCEGNDSRLSDARTPVAHTHTKSDVTDLFNSANTWSETNTYSKAVAIERSTDTGNFLALKNTVAELGSTPASATPATIAFRDKNNDNLGYMGVFYDTDGSNHFRLYVRNKFTSGSPSTTGSYDYAFFGLRLNADKSKEGILKASFRPYDNNTYDLGSSSYQWNNLYAKNYFYNGVAWGLDKANVWSAIQTISYAGSNVAIALKNQETDITASPTRNNWHYINFYDKNSVSLGGFNYSKRTNGNSRVYLNLRTKNTNNDIVEKNVFFETNQEGTDWNLYSASNADINLGTSTNKWKTLNGINPGALSLPDTYINIDTTNWGLTGTLFSYTPPIDGWLFVNIRPDNNYAYVALECAHMRNNSESTTGKNAMACIAVRATVQVSITLIGASIAQARLVTCAGNV